MNPNDIQVGDVIERVDSFTIYWPKGSQAEVESISPHVIRIRNLSTGRQTAIFKSTLPYLWQMVDDLHKTPIEKKIKRMWERQKFVKEQCHV